MAVAGESGKFYREGIAVHLEHLRDEITNVRGIRAIDWVVRALRCQVPLHALLIRKDGLICWTIDPEERWDIPNCGSVYGEMVYVRTFIMGNASNIGTLLSREFDKWFEEVTEMLRMGGPVWDAINLAEQTFEWQTLRELRKSLMTISPANEVCEDPVCDAADGCDNEPVLQNTAPRSSTFVDYEHYTVRRRPSKING